MTMYSKEIIDHFQNPKNMGAIEGVDAVGSVGNPVCGDIMKIYIKVGKNESGEDAIKDIGFETLGCVAAISTTSMITEMAKGKTLDEAMKIEFKDVESALGEIPPVKLHCADLSVRALREAIGQYKNSNRIS
ncbi:MAG: iron-sulfur cluster assembly scaffold protein [Candidatus Colwellbacteria bacterium]|nr:iron-sulfur cluster assembly scaffold protein [Candidatus Colwellbacteria bacterium]